jgi:hypothetical protein
MGDLWGQVTGGNKSGGGSPSSSGGGGGGSGSGGLTVPNIRRNPRGGYGFGQKTTTPPSLSVAPGSMASNLGIGPDGYVADPKSITSSPMYSIGKSLGKIPKEFQDKLEAGKPFNLMELSKGTPTEEQRKQWADQGVTYNPGSSASKLMRRGSALKPLTSKIGSGSGGGDKESRRYTSGNQNVDEAITKAAKSAGIDPNTMKSIASIESNMDPSSNSDKKTQYKGLFQIGSEEWKKYGQGGDIYNPEDNAMAAARMFKDHTESFQKQFGRPPTDTSARTWFLYQRLNDKHRRQSLSGNEGTTNLPIL